MGATHTTNAISGARETIDIDWGRVEEALRKLNSRPDGAFTIRDYANKYDVTYYSAKNTLGNLVAAGELERTDPSHGKKVYFWFQENK